MILKYSGNSKRVNSICESILPVFKLINRNKNEVEEKWKTF